MRGVVAEVHVLDRLLLLGELAGGLVGVVWLLRPARLHHVPWHEASGPWLRFVGGWLRLAGMALGIGVIATLLGYTSLADRINISSLLRQSPVGRETVAGNTTEELTGLKVMLFQKAFSCGVIPQISGKGRIRPELHDRTEAALFTSKGERA